MTRSTTEIPGYRTGTWAIDPARSTVAFTVRHLGVTKVRGRFAAFEGTVVTGDDVLGSAVSAVIQAASLTTGNVPRDDGTRGPDLLDTANHPTVTFTSTGVRTGEGDGFLIDGDLTLRGVTRPVTLTARIGGFGTGAGREVLGVSAGTEISRADFGLGPAVPGAVISDRIRIDLDVEAARQP